MNMYERWTLVHDMRHATSFLIFVSKLLVIFNENSIETFWEIFNHSDETFGSDLFISKIIFW